MAALAGEPWRGAARASVFVTATPANNHQAWVSFDVNATAPAGDQATWAGTPGSSLTLRFRWVSNGTGSGQQAPTFATVRAMLPGGAQLGTDWTVAFPAAGTEVTRTFHFDNDPMDAALGANREGMVELYLNWGSTGGALPWSQDSRGTTAGLLGTNTAEWARGKARAPVTLSAFSISDASLGGAEPATFFATKSTFNRVTLDNIWYRGAVLLMKHRQSGADVRSSDADTPNDTAVQRNYTWNAAASGAANKGRINKDYAIGASAVDARIVLPSNTFGGTSADLEYVWAAGGHLAGWTVTDNSTLDKTSRFTADPRTKFTQLLQLDDAVFGTPPLSKNIANSRLANSQVPELAFRISDEAGTPNLLNGITWTEKAWDNGNITGSQGSPTVSRTATSQAQGGENGWSDAFLSFGNSKPGGIWNHKAVITAPADMVGTEDGSNAATVTMVAANPDYRVIPAGGGADASQPLRHFYPGEPFIAGAALINLSTGVFMPVDVSPSPYAYIGRFNLALGRAEYLDSDYSWKAVTGSTGAYKWPLTASGGDANAYITTIPGSVTSSWSYTPLVLPILFNNGTAYGIPAASVLAGAFRPHDVAGLEWGGVPP